MMPSRFVLNDQFFSPEDIQLASLIPNIRDPELDALESPTPLTPKDYTIRVVRDYSTFLQRHTDTRVQLFLSRIAQLFVGRSRRSDIGLSARLGRIYTLRKPGAMFDMLCKDTDVREWLQERIEDRSDVYLVIGLHTLFDTRAEEGAQLAQHYAGTLELPLEEVAAAPNVGFSGGYEQGQDAANSYVAPGEQIWGIRVKKLKFKTFQVHEVDRMRLARDSVWKMAAATRDEPDEYSEFVDAGLEGEESEGQDEYNSAQDDNTEISFVTKSGK
jgi:hypothetical protein